MVGHLAYVRIVRVCIVQTQLCQTTETIDTLKNTVRCKRGVKHVQVTMFQYEVRASHQQLLHPLRIGRIRAHVFVGEVQCFGVGEVAEERRLLHDVVTEEIRDGDANGRPQESFETLVECRVARGEIVKVGT